MEQRRSDRRYERRVPIDFSHDGRTQTAHTRNISLGGVFIETDSQLPCGARVAVRFTIPTQREPIEVEGQVRWLQGDDDEERRGIGVRLDGLRARDVWALNKFFETPR